MEYLRKPLLVGISTLCGVLTMAHANPKSPQPGNSYHLFTKALSVNESGVAKVPPRFQWSVETSWSGVDVQGRNLPDTRVMLRLYDPQENVTALTAQLQLETAEKLHRELGAMIARKRQNPHFQHRPKLYSPDKIPISRLIGVKPNGEAIIEFETPVSGKKPVLDATKPQVKDD